MELAKVFVIIVTYKGKLWYDRCFSSLRNSEIPLHTVVIDNASNDGTVEYIRENFPEVHIIPSEKNLGFGQGNNKGMRYALDNGADYVFLLNQDAWIEPSTLNELIEIHKKNPQYGILSPMHINADKTAIEKGLINYVADLKITDPAWINDLYFNNMKAVYSTNYVNAAAWLLPRKTLETVGGFDPIFYHYGEDDNYMHRVIYHRMRIGICPKVKVVHDTERRVKGTKKTVQNNLKNLLVELCDINNNRSLFQYIISLTKQILRKTFKLEYKVVYGLFYELKFVLMYRKKIEKSKRVNTKINSSWL